MVFGWSKKEEGEVSVEPVPSNEAIGETTAIEHANNLVRFRKMHQWDLHMEIDKLESISDVVESGDVEKEAAFEESLLGENSPYPEVRASVSSLVPALRTIYQLQLGLHYSLGRKHR